MFSPSSTSMGKWLMFHQPCLIAEAAGQRGHQPVQGESKEVLQAVRFFLERLCLSLSLAYVERW